MEITQALLEEMEEQARNSAFDTRNEWLKGLYTGEAMAYKIISIAKDI